MRVFCCIIKNGYFDYNDGEKVEQKDKSWVNYLL